MAFIPVSSIKCENEEKSYSKVNSGLRISWWMNGISWVGGGWWGGGSKGRSRGGVGSREDGGLETTGDISKPRTLGDFVSHIRHMIGQKSVKT